MLKDWILTQTEIKAPMRELIIPWSFHEDEVIRIGLVWIKCIYIYHSSSGFLVLALKQKDY